MKVFNSNNPDGAAIQRDDEEFLAKCGGRGGRGGGGLGGWTVLNAERATRYSSNSLQLVQPGFN